MATTTATDVSAAVAAATATLSSPMALRSPVYEAFPHIQWDSLHSLKLTAQETALLRMAETNPMDYTLADSRDASMYARVLLKLLAEAATAGAGSGAVSTLLMSSNNETLPVNAAVEKLQVDPLGVVSHYALSKLLEILETLATGVKGVTIASVFYVGKEGILVDQWKALLRLLNKGGKGDLYAQKVASLCLAKLLITACPSQQQRASSSSSSSTTGSPPSTGSTKTTSAVTTTDNNKDKAQHYRPVQYASAIEPLEALIAWIVSQLKNATGLLVSICTPALKALMEATETRALFCQASGLKYMSRQIRVGSKSKSLTSAEKKKFGPASVQQLYEITFCLWVLTYDLDTAPLIRADFTKDGAAIAALVDLVSIAPREKVVRVALSALRNLAYCTSNQVPAASGLPVVNGHTFLSEMIACGLMKAIDHLRDRQFTDPDLVNDVDILHKLLHENYKEMSRWEVYQNEVESGRLQWGSTHTEAFFKINARMVEGSDGDFHILKVLIALVASSSHNHDEEVTAIACYDIGEFVRHYPNGRAIAKRLGAKELIMPLIEHDNPELQRHALQCVSKIMVQNWEYVK
jgi:V-type H+-transporting ATPase subunit H